MKHLSSVVQQLQYILLSNHWTLSIAESLTGGLCQATLVEQPGISRVFSGGIVSYTDEIKHQLLHVDKEVLSSKTAVSREVAQQMAEGVQKIFKSDVSLSFTGEAGPFVQAGHLGQVFISVMIKEEIYTTSLQLSGHRQEIREQAVELGLVFLLKHLQKHN